jgi:predicted ribonuclease YlaK
VAAPDDTTAAEAVSDPPRHRTYVLDTSVLLADPRAMLRFEEHEVVLPVVVITELEGKRHHPELGYFARSALRFLDGLRVEHGRLDAPIAIGERGGTIRVELNHTNPESLPAGFRLGDNDTRILAVARNLSLDGHDVTLVSKDVPLRVKASAVGLIAEEYRAELVSESGWTGMTEVETVAATWTHCSTTGSWTSTRRATSPATPGWSCSAGAAARSDASAPTSGCTWCAVTARRSASAAGRPSSASRWRCCWTRRSASSRWEGGLEPASPRWPCVPGSRR